MGPTILILPNRRDSLIYLTLSRFDLLVSDLRVPLGRPEILVVGESLDRQDIPANIVRLNQ